MQNNQLWIDVTAQMQSIRKQMKMMQLIKQDTITLEDCMQAQEINDQKMDPKFDICYKHTIKSKLQDKLVKLPQNLTIKQLADIFANVMQLEACIMQGQPLNSTIYQFAYLYDRRIWENSYLFTALIQSIHAFGSYLHDVVKQAGSIKEDDITISGFSFSRNIKTHDQVSELILQAQKKFQAQFKKNEDKISYNIVQNILKLRRSIHLFVKNMGVNFDPKNQKKIETDIQSIKKKLLSLKQIKYQGKLQLLPGVFLNDLQKTLKVHFGPRPLKLTTFQQSVNQIQNSLQQLQLFFPIPNRLSQLKNRVIIMQSMPYNALSKSYIKSNIFLKQHYIFSSLKTQQIITADINDWVHLSQNVKNNQKYINLISTAAPVLSETVYRLLGNSMRWHWQCSKIYQDYNILVHMANQVDSVSPYANTNKQLYIASWFYYYGLQLMIQQLFVSFKNNLYEQSQLKYVFYVVENVLGISQRNGNIFLRHLDKSVFQNFNENNFNKNIKKKMSENQLKMFANFLFRKGQYLYFRAIFKTFCILHAKKLIQNKFAQTQQLRIKNRFRIFKNILFMKTIDYQQYKKTVDQVCAKQAEYLNQSLQQLKQVKKLYTLFTQFKDDQTFFRQHQDAKKLVQLSVKASLVVITLKMNGGANKKFSVELSGRFPQFKMQ